MVFNFHPGKLAVQGRAGTTEEAQHVLNAGWIGTTISSSGESQMADPDFREVYLSSVDQGGLVWASVVVGEPGFVSMSQSPTNDAFSISITSGNRGFVTYNGDPLDENIRLPDAPVGMLFMGYKNRRRYRIDGRVISTTSGTTARTSAASVAGGGGDAPLISNLTFEVTMAMGNCPKYVHVRELVKQEQAPLTPLIKRSSTLSHEQRDWIGVSTTLTLGTYAGGKNGGADASNRGGNAGFVTALDDSTIVFPDYRGNNLYLSLGNITANPKAGLLFINRQTGDVLQVSGEAHVVWAEDENSPVFPPGGSTGKHVRIDVLAVVEAKGAYPLRMRMKELSPFNPPLPANTKTSGLDGTGQQEEQRHNFVMRCKEVVDAASGVKSFRFEPAALVGAGDKGGDEKNKDPAWTPGQYATFFFPSCEGVGCGTEHQGLYTLPLLESPGEVQQKGAVDEPVVRNWTITSVHGEGSPLEITVQAKAGGVSEHMHSNLMAGELVRVAVGGDFTLTDRMGAPPGPDSKVLLLSAGIGVTPMIGALRWLRQREAKRCSDPNRCLVPGHPDVVALHATRSKDAVPYLSEVIQHATAAASADEGISDEARRIRFILAITRAAASASTAANESAVPGVTLTGNKRGPLDGAKGEDGVKPSSGFSIVEGRPNTEMLKREVPDVADRQVLLCGPDSFMAAMEGNLKGLGVSSSNIHIEEFYF